MDSSMILLNAHIQFLVCYSFSAVCVLIASYVGCLGSLVVGPCVRGGLPL
jgi:hypothetical protein